MTEDHELGPLEHPDGLETQKGKDVHTCTTKIPSREKREMNTSMEMKIIVERTYP